MDQYDELVIKAENQGIRVIELNLEGECGYCYNDTIFVNYHITSIQKKCILIEELGHYHTTFGDIMDQSKIENRKQELKARRWGYQNLLSLDSVLVAYENKITNLIDLADYLGVTEDFIKCTVDYYKCKYGLYCRYKNYYICFEPTIRVSKIS